VEEALERERGEVDLLRRRVINVVGHEFRTPVSTLRGLADQLARTEDPALRSDLNVALQRSATRVEELLDDLLLAAGVTTVLPVGPPETTAVAPAAEEVWSALGSPRPLEMDAGAVHVTATAGVLRRLLTNLLDNAVKYGRGPVRLTATDDGEHVVVEIAAVGDPMSVADLRLAFELFYRGEHAVTSSPGLGVGLPVARALARQHGGDVELAGGDDRVVTRLVLPAR
jgi:signal transduction histidine kinase